MSRGRKRLITDKLDEVLGGAVEAAPLPQAEKQINFTFVKNLNPREIITLEDGTKLQFKGTKFETEDKNLARMISNVAESYGIFES
jgi:hypothetical protein